MQRALGEPVSIRRRPDGRPEVIGDRVVSASHAGDLTLADRLNTFAPLWRMIVDHGEFHTVERDGQLELRVLDFPAATELYGHRLGGWLEGYVECLTGELWPVELLRCEPGAPVSLAFRLVPT